MNTTNTYTANGAVVDVADGGSFNLLSGGSINATGHGFSGGSFVFSTGIYVHASGTATIAGGRITATDSPAFPSVALYVSNRGTVDISGGSFGAGLEADTGGTIDLFGTNFTDGNGNAFTGPITSGSGTIRGTLLDGQFLDTTYSVDNTFSGTIEFNDGPAPAPEPSQFAALGIGVLGLVTPALRVRRRTRAV